MFDVLADREVMSSFSAKVSANIEAFTAMISSYSDEKDTMEDYRICMMACW